MSDKKSEQKISTTLSRQKITTTLSRQKIATTLLQGMLSNGSIINNTTIGVKGEILNLVKKAFDMADLILINTTE